MKKVNYLGKRFGRLIVIAESESRNGNSYWDCWCDCGNEATVSAPALKSGHTQSCGCIKNELLAARSRKHAMSGERAYRIWAGMKSRCRNKNHKNYAQYGERGIAVCDEWKSFEGFYRWALSSGYTDELTIDRIDVNGDYCPENCRWATVKEQQNNRRDNLPLVKANGKEMTISDWAKQTGLSYGKIHGRIYALGYSAEMAING